MYVFLFGGRDAQEHLPRMASPRSRNVHHGVHLSHLLSATTHLTAVNSMRQRCLIFPQLLTYFRIVTFYIIEQIYHVLPRTPLHTLCLVYAESVSPKICKLRESLLTLYIQRQKTNKPKKKVLHYEHDLLWESSSGWCSTLGRAIVFFEQHINCKPMKYPPEWSHGI